MATSEGRVDGRRDLVAEHAALLRRWIWRDFVNITLGIWLITSPATLGYGSTLMWWSDIASGTIVVVLGSLALWPRFDLLRWGVAGVGLWLFLAPLVFWAPEASAYANDTLVGALLITFSVLVPTIPGRTPYAVITGPGPEKPPGWTYNPSGWFQRGPIIAMAFVGVFISRYLAAYQLGHIQTVWDPFGDGTRRVLESEVSRAWPVSDAGLGAVSYMLEALSGFMGGRNRWRTMPWMVALFGMLVVPLGVVSLALVMLQPIGVGAWCTLCLVTAAAMLIMIAPAADEVVAMGQFLAGARREGKPFWRTFWLGGTLDSYEREPARPEPPDTSAPVGVRLVQALDLGNVPWTLLASAALGVWTMAVPTVLGVTGRAADLDHMGGALIVTWAVVGFGEILRPVRLLNVAQGLLMAIAPWILSGHTDLSRWNDVVVGVVLVGLSLPRGRIDEQFASWNRYLRW